MKFSFLVAFFLTATASLLAQAQVSRADYGFQKVIWVVLENTNAKDALNEPYLMSLTQQGALLANMSGESHPSQPNYIAMIAGDSLGVRLDSNADLDGQHLGDLLEGHGRTWKNYAEDFPGNCFTGSSSGKYARKHVPFISFNNVHQDAKRCANITTGDQFDQDLAAGTLPDFTMYIPNLNNDGHDTGVTASSAFIQKKFGALLNDPKFMKDKLFIVTFDESESYFTNKIYTVVLGANVKPGAQSNQSLNHVSLLHLIEEQWALGNLGRKDATAPMPEGIWQ